MGLAFLLADKPKPARTDQIRWTGGVGAVPEGTRVERRAATGQNRWSVWIVAVALVTSSVSADTLSDPRAVPSDAWMVFSIASFPSAWGAFAQTALYEEIAAFLESSAATGVPGYREFLLAKQAMETELAFPVTGDSLAQMVAGIDFVLLPPSREAPATWACVFRVSDPTRFRRFMDYVARQMAGRQGDGSVPSRAVETIEYRQVKIVSSVRGPSLALAELRPERFAMGGSVQAVRRIVDQVKKGEGLAGDWRFRAAIGSLRETDPHGFLYLNTAAAPPAVRRGGPQGLPLSTLVHTFRDGIAMAAGFHIEKQAIRFESYLPFVRTAQEHLAAIYRRYPPARLHSLDYISSSPLIFTARNTLDGPSVYQGLRDVVRNSMRVANAGENPEKRLAQAEDDFRDEMGFGLESDLAPAVGPEAFICLEDVRFDPLVPLPMLELVAGVQVRDQARMDKVVKGFEEFFERRLGNRPGGQSVVPLRATPYEGEEVKSFDIPRVPLYSFGYVRTTDFVLMGLGRDSVKHALDRAAGRRPAYGSGELQARLRPLLHEKCNEAFVVNIAKLVAVGREITRRLALGDPEQAASARQMDTLLVYVDRIEAVGASTVGSESGLHTRGAIVFRPASGKRPRND